VNVGEVGTHPKLRLAKSRTISSVRRRRKNPPVNEARWSLTAGRSSSRILSPVPFPGPRITQGDVAHNVAQERNAQRNR
jgi:hypothetical protein